jgi:hypothetical protein
MKAILKTLLITLCFSQALLAQKEPSLKMHSDPKPWGNDEMQALAEWQNLDYHKIKFTGNQLKGKNYYIVSKEFWKGEITKSDTIFKSGQLIFQPVQSDTLAFTILGGRTSDKSLRADFKFDRFSIEADFDCKNTNDYSLRVHEWLPIEPGQPFYAFSYILPYEKGEYKFYCAVEGSGKDMEKWYEEFGIEHYVLFEMKFY